VLQTEGIRGLFKGIGAVLVGGIPGVTIYMTSYEYFKDNLSQYTNSQFAVYFAGGMLAEAISCIVFVPVDVVKERLQVQRQKLAETPKHSTNGISCAHQQLYYRNSYDALMQIYTQEGIRGIYRGYGATMLSYGPFSALYFLLYEETKALLLTQKGRTFNESAYEISAKENVDLSFMESLACSAFAGSVSSLVTNPLDLAKLRLQIERAGSQVAASSSSTSSSSLSTRAPLNDFGDALINVYRTEGIRGLFRGAGARVLFHTPNMAITMAMFEQCKKIWGSILGIKGEND
jgi:hypothetical protein